MRFVSFVDVIHGKRRPPGWEGPPEATSGTERDMRRETAEEDVVCNKASPFKNVVVLSPPSALCSVGL